MEKIVKNVFVSWTSNNKVEIEKYMNAISNTTKLSYYLSDYDCIGDFEQWFKDEINNAPFFLVYITKESLDKEFVKKEVEEIIAKYKKYNYKFITFISEVTSKKINQLDKEHHFYKLINECKVSGVFTENKTFDETIKEISEKIEIMTKQYDLLEYSNRLEKDLDRFKLLANTSFQSLSNFFTQRVLIDEFEQQEVDYDNLINKKKVLIRGEAGSGKSLYIQHLASILNKTSNVFILENNEVQEMISSNSSIISYLYKEIKATLLQEDDFKILMKRATNYLMIEGLDEVISKNKIKLLEKINQFTNEYDNFNIIFTSRNNEDINDAFKVKLLPLDEKKIQETAKKYICFYSNNEEKQHNFYLALNDINEEIKNNPLLLSQLAYIYSITNTLPNNKLDLYDEITSLFVKERNEDNIEVNLNDVIKDFIKNNRKILSKCAYKLVINKDNKDYTFLKALSTCLDNEDDANEVYKYLKARSIINIKDEFYHKTFLEYFASSYIFIKDNGFYEEDDIDGLIPTNKLIKLISKEDISDLYEMMLLHVDNKCEEEGIKQSIQILINDTTKYFYLLNILKQKNIFAKYLLKPLFEKVVKKEEHPYHELLYYTVKNNLYVELLLLAKETNSQDLNYMYAFIQDIICLYSDINIKDYEDLYLDNINKIQNDGTKRYQNLINYYLNGNADVYFYYEDDEYNIYKENDNKLIGHIIVNRQTQLQGKVTKKIIGLSIIDHENFHEEFDSYYKKTIKYYILPKKLKSLNNIFTDNQIVRIIVMNNELTYIGNEEFKNASNLWKISISEGVTSIGDDAFRGCSNLINVTIPKSITNISLDAFICCDNLINVYYQGTIEDWCHISFSSAYSNPMIYAKHFNMLDDNNGWYETTEIEIPKIVTLIGQYQFYRFDNITSITIPEGVRNIGESAFEGCNNLTNIYYKGTIEDWCHISFSSAYSNPMIYAKHFNMLDDNNEWYEVTKIEIPKKITLIGQYQFYRFDNITSITIPEGVRNIGESAFEECNNLINIYYKGTIEDWCNIKFSNYTANPMHVKCVYMLDDNNEYHEVKYESHFYMRDINDKWYEVTEITLPSGITFISNQFSGFNYVTKIIIPNNVTSIGDSAFSGCTNLVNVYYEGTIEDWCKIELQTYESNPMYHAKCFYILDKDGKWYDIKSKDKLEIPNIITSIGDFTFSTCYNLKSIIIPENIISIGYCAFSGCSNLKNVIISKKTKSIGDSAFYNCTSLTSITIPEGVTSIGDSAFYNCTSLISITIPEGVTSIGNSAFYNCTSLTSITIHKGITNIGWCAFENCINLKNVYYEGTIEDWCHISFSSAYSNPMIYAKHFNMLDQNKKWYDIKSKDKLEISNKVENINEYQFIGLNNLISLFLPKSLKTIKYSGFDKCPNLKNIYYAGKVKNWLKINKCFFENEIYLSNDKNEYCKINEITKIELPNSITTIRSQLDCFSSLENIIIPKSVKNIYPSAFNFNNKKINIYYKGNIEDWCKIKIDGAIFNAFQIINDGMIECNKIVNLYMLNRYNEWEEVTEIDIPNTITKIWGDQFYIFKNIKSIILPNNFSLSATDSYNFEKIYYKGTIEDWCNNLRLYYEKTSEDNTLFITKKPINLFLNHIPYVEHFYMLNKNNEFYEVIDIEIPDTIKSIGSYAFSGFGSLTSITIPKGVTSIGYEAFNECNNLTNVYYQGTIEDWCKIDFETGSSNPMKYAKHFYMLDKNSEWYEETNIKIPDTITSIGDNQFYGFDILRSLIISKSVISIANTAFIGCNNIKKLIISENFLDEIENLFTSETILKKYRNKEYVIKDGMAIFE